MNLFKNFKNPDITAYQEICDAVDANEGYCPCMTEKNDDTKCMCKEFREMEEADFCHCGRFYKVPIIDTIALVGDISDDLADFERWEMILSKIPFIVIPVRFSTNNSYYFGTDYLNLSKAKIAKADAVFVLADESDWMLEMEAWAVALGKKVIHRSDLINEDK